MTLAERLEIAADAVQAMNGLLAVHVVRDEMTTARALGEETIALAEQLGNPPMATTMHVLLGMALLNAGEAAAARLHAEEGRTLLGPEVPPGQNEPRVVWVVSTYNLQAWACAQLGQVSESRAMLRAALERAGRLGAPFHSAQARTMTAQGWAMLRDVAEAHQLAEEAVRFPRSTACRSTASRRRSCSGGAMSRRDGSNPGAT